jgi:hypothetical protein
MNFIFFNAEKVSMISFEILAVFRFDKKPSCEGTNEKSMAETRPGNLR